MVVIATEQVLSDAFMPRTWEIIKRPGPVLATAIHAGHLIRDELKPYLAVNDEEQRLEEDPLTGVWAGVGDSVFRTYTSRFEVDLNRRRTKAFSEDPKDTWGMQVWRQRPPENLVEHSLAAHDSFYFLMKNWIESMLVIHEKILVLDIHSYNHRRNEGKPAPAEQNPDIDLGVTTADLERFGGVIEQLELGLQTKKPGGLRFDVRRNVRYPDGGHFPEWIYARYGEAVCTVTLEIKKFYMNEHSGQASLAIADELHRAISLAKELASEELSRCS